MNCCKGTFTLKSMAEKSIIKEIETKVARLLDDHKRISDLNSDLLLEREQLRAENRKLVEQNTKLNRENSLLQLGDGLGGKSADPTKAKARVNQLMREVDKCIALLNGVEQQ